MLALLSPAKSLDLTPPPVAVEATQPVLLEESARLVAVARRLSATEIGALMKVSPTLAERTRDRFHAFVLPFDGINALPAALTFDGAVYRGLAARELGADDLAWAQERLGILSGLYGLLRPLDLIQPYRLEMGTRLKTQRGANLYGFWGDRITRRIREVVAGHDDPTVVNLASVEYFKAVRPKGLHGSVVACVFEEWQEGPEDGRVVAVYAKRARGLMARYLIDARIDRAEGLKEFDAEGYRFQAGRSTESRWVFARKRRPAGQ